MLLPDGLALPQKLAAALAAAVVCLAAAAPAFASSIPASIASDCSSDVTQPILSWIASTPDDADLSFGSGACYRIDGTLELTGRRGLRLEGNGATFRAAGTGATSRSQWRLVGGSRISFRNMTVQGSHPAGGTFVAALQHQHAFDLRGVAGVELDRVQATDVYGDCVYVGQGWDAARSWSRDVHVHDSACDRNGRMGIAVVAGREVLVERVRLANIALTAFDLEPNGAGFGARNITFRNNQAGAPLPGGFFTAVGDGPVDSVTVSDNTVTGGGMYMAVLARRGQRRSDFTISGNSSDTGHSAPGSAAVDLERVDGATITQNSIPLSAAGMALASVSESCNVAVRGNRFPGGIMEARVSSPSCDAPSELAAVQLTAPAEGAVFSSRLAMRADVRSNREVSKVEFRAGGRLLRTDRTRPYSYTWRPRKRRSRYGRYTITARAYVESGPAARDSVRVARLRRTSTTLGITRRGVRAGSRRVSAARRARGRVRGSRSGWTVIHLERFDPGTRRWLSAGTRKRQVNRRGTFTTRLAGLDRGRWRARARFRGTSRKAPSTSRHRYFRVG